jgi:hypothetical protein
MSRLPTHRSRHSLSSASMQAASAGAPATYGGMVPASAGNYGLLGRPMPQEGMELREGAYKNPHEEDVGRLMRLDWVQALLAEPDVHVVLQCSAMNPDPGVDPDHLVCGCCERGCCVCGCCHTYFLCPSISRVLGLLCQANMLAICSRLAWALNSADLGARSVLCCDPPCPDG